jgi:hypothetical protein
VRIRSDSALPHPDSLARLTELSPESGMPVRVRAGVTCQCDVAGKRIRVPADMLARLPTPTALGSADDRFVVLDRVFRRWPVGACDRPCIE